MAKLNERGFDENGLYHTRIGIQETTSTVDKYGFNADGKYVSNGVERYLNPRGFEYRGINVYTGKKYDFNFFDIDGYFWKQYDGEYKNSYSKYNDEGLDLYGFDMRGIHSVTELPWDEYLFTADGINIATYSRYNAYGYERDEYYKTPRSINASYPDTEEYLNMIKGFNSIDRVLYTIDREIAKGILSDKTLRDEFMRTCRELKKKGKVYSIKKGA